MFESKSRSLYVYLAAIVLLAIVVFLLLIRPSNEPFDLKGKISLSADGAFSMNPRCGGKDGYDDINPGAAVVVYDSAGKVLAKGALGEGRFSSQSFDAPCVFEFVVKDVPSGEKFYQVQVTHRGKVPVQEADAKAGTAAFTLG